MANLTNWQLEAVSVAWWEETTRRVSFDGSTYNVTSVVLRPDWFGDLRVEQLTKISVRIDYDTDKR